MELGTVFKLSLYGLTALVGVILGAAEGEGIGYVGPQNHFVLPFASLPLVVAGFLITEGRTTSPSSEGRGLSSFWANLLGIIALFATAREFFSENREGKLLAGTHLLLYVTWIVLFQQKTVRLYWFLMALGILQLAVASVLTSKGWFGFCAIIYMFSAVWTLSIFSLWRAERLFTQEELRLSGGRGSPPDRELQSASNAGESSEVYSSVQHEPGTRWLSLRFVTGVLMTTSSALVVSTLFFLFIPRVWVISDVSGADISDASDSKPRSSLASTVRLGYLAPTLESNERVFEIQLFNLRTQRPMSVSSYAELLGMAEPLFRGGVLVNYENGRWKHDDMVGTPFRIFKGMDKSLTEIAVKQEIFLEASSSDVMYCLGTPLFVVDRRDKPIGLLEKCFSILKRGEEAPLKDSLPYTVYSTLPIQEQMRYRVNVESDARRYYASHRYLDQCKQFPQRSLYRVDELARRIVQAETARVNKAEQRTEKRLLTPIEIAGAIETALRDSKEYQYSLEFSVVDSAIDPIEDFLFNRKQGHCEYFATAMALMLRAQGIPSRVIIGYKGGHQVAGRDVLEVQQKYAHLWVEAWVDNSGWTTFDATPMSERSASIAAISAKQKSIWQGVQSTFSGLWSENVLNMSLDRQEASLYKPLRKVMYSSADFLRQLFKSPRMALASVWATLMNREQWFSIEGGLFAFFLMVFIVASIWLFKRLVWLVRACLGSRGIFGAGHRLRFVEFYDRFQRLAQAKGLKRSPQQTQSEFADVVASAYSPELTAFGLSDFPQSVSRLFYRVRFGDQNLSDAEISDMNEQLAQFELALANESQRSTV